ncbi:D-alanyl-D-alanine carboxypeptidase [Candidatus Saccharibacteria bacterium]|nr:D-alanyl-D-alanine carboxypeptidase [Candidatus Saccharibacteria bacterium]
MTRRRRFNRNFWIVPCLILAGFLIFVEIRMAIMDAKVDFLLDFVAPESDFTGIEYQPGFGQWAVALNGETVSKSAEELSVQPTASTAKMILALAVMEKKPFALGETGEPITITDDLYSIYANYVAIGGSTTVVQVGEVISEYDALASALIASSNNMADSLAVWAFGSLAEYQKYAQEMVTRLGAHNTTVGPDASGFDDATTSTAEDLARIGEAVLKQPVLAEIVGKTSAAVPVAGEIENTNKLLGIDGIIGVKTGYIGASSGYCLVSGYKENDEIMTVALLGAPYRQTSFEATEAIVAQAQEKIKPREIVGEGQTVAHYYTWWTGDVPVKTTKAMSGIIVSNASAAINSENLIISTAESEYTTPVSVEDFPKQPNLFQRFLHIFGWKAE